MGGRGGLGCVEWVQGGSSPGGGTRSYSKVSQNGTITSDGHMKMNLINQLAIEGFCYHICGTIKIIIKTIVGGGARK